MAVVVPALTLTATIRMKVIPTTAAVIPAGMDTSIPMMTAAVNAMTVLTMTTVIVGDTEKRTQIHSGLYFQNQTQSAARKKALTASGNVRKLKTAGKVLRFLKKFMRRKNERVQNCRKSVKC